MYVYGIGGQRWRGGLKIPEREKRSTAWGSYLVSGTRAQSRMQKRSVECKENNRRGRAELEWGRR